MNKSPPKIAILGASGLIGYAITTGLLAQGHPTTPIARRFTKAQIAEFGPLAITAPFVGMEIRELTQLLADQQIDIVVNCVGLLQNRGRDDTSQVHAAFTERLITALQRQAQDTMLVQISIPGNPQDDATDFSRTKHQGDIAIRTSKLPHIILRPGFVIAPEAYGGSALIRSLAVAPFTLSDQELMAAFRPTAISDIVETIRVISRRWVDGERDWHDEWDVMAREPSNVGEIISAFRQRFGVREPRLRLPSWIMGVGAKAGDIASWLGWSPPIRSTALHEMQRGVEGDPTDWIAATQIQPKPLASILADLRPTIQERWFARLYLLKAIAITTLAGFWIASGLIALTVAFGAAGEILVAMGFPPAIAPVLNVIFSSADIAIGITIGFKRFCKPGLLTGIALSAAYMGAAALLAPGLWLDPLGAILKTGPAIILMLMVLAVLEDR